MHNGDEEIWHFTEILAEISELVEEIREGLKILEVLIGLSPGSLDLLLQLAEGPSVGGLVLLEEFKNLLNALRVELFADSIQVVGLVPPEVDLSEGIRVLVSLESRLRVLLENILNLLSPCDNGA